MRHGRLTRGGANATNEEIGKLWALAEAAIFMVCRWRSMLRPPNWNGRMGYSNAFTPRMEARCQVRADSRALLSGSSRSLPVSVWRNSLGRAT
jgi:hypothetical protein